MIPFRRSGFYTGLAALFLSAPPSALLAQDTTPVIVANPIPNVTVTAGTASSVVKIKDTFGLQGVSDKIVRFTTSLGKIDVELDSTDAPLTVANFLSYVKDGSYVNSFIHRSVTNFVIQGGGYDVVNGNVDTIPAKSPVQNEFKVSNTRGTIAMAKLGSDPNSATDEWFFNEVDNSGSPADLDTQDGGFTVFGHIIESGLSVMDAIGALQIVHAQSPFDNLPVLSSYNGMTVENSDLVYTSTISLIPLTPAVQGDPAILKVRVKTNTNPDLVTATLSGRKITLTYMSGVTGTATITLAAKNKATGSAVTTSFDVTVQPAPM